MRINNNIMALNAHRQLGMNQAGASKSMEKLSSGFRINRAGDDAAGLAISEKMRGQIRGLKQASRNAQDGISLIQTAEGALNETHAILQRMRELAVQSATDTNTGVDRGEIQKEIDQLAAELSRIAETTEFNTQNLLGGGFEGKFHIGANEGQDITLQINNMDAHALKVGGHEAAVFEQKVTAVFANVADGEYTAMSVDNYSGEKLQEAAINVGTVASTKYVLVDKNGEAVATSVDGLTWTEYGEGITAGTFTTTETVANNGKVTIAGTDVTAEVGVTGDANGLSAGKYTVKDISYNPIYGATYGIGLVNDKGEIVALATDGTTPVAAGAIASVTTFVDVNDTSNVLLSVNVGHGLALDDEISATGTGIDVSSQKAASAAITTINDALETVSEERSKLGAMQNRLEHTIANLGTSAENLQAAESRIRDLDMAEEIMAFTKNNILQQAATAMLAQANMAPQSVLQLLG